MFAKIANERKNMRLFNKLIDRIGVPSLLVLGIIALVLVSVMFSRDALASYMYREMSEPFLEQSR